MSTPKRWSGQITPLMKIGTAIRDARERLELLPTRLAAATNIPVDMLMGGRSNVRLGDSPQVGIDAIRASGSSTMIECVQYCERRIEGFRARPQSRKTRTSIKYYDRWRRLVGAVLLEWLAVGQSEELS